MDHQGSFDEWWQHGGRWYISGNVTKDEFSLFPLRNGFSRGDIIILKGVKPKDIKTGDIIVFKSHKSRPRPDPIIHRVVRKWEANSNYFFQTKGDNYNTNTNSINSCDGTGCIDETSISEGQVIGNAVFRVPFLGYVKIWAVEGVCLFGDFSFCIRS